MTTKSIAAARKSAAARGRKNLHPVDFDDGAYLNARIELAKCGHSIEAEFGEGRAGALKERASLRRALSEMRQQASAKSAKVEEDEAGAAEFEALVTAIEWAAARIDKISSDMDNDDAAEAMFTRNGNNAASQRPEWMDADGNAVRALGPKDRFSDLIRARNTDAEPLPPDALGRMVKAMVTGDSRSMDAIGRDYPISSMTTGRDADGGVWIAPEVAGGIIDAARAQSVIVQAGARTIEMTSPEMKLVRVEEDAQPGWLGEKQKAVEDSPGFGALRLVAKKLFVVVPVASELFEDAENLGNELNRLLAEAFAAELDRAGLVGNGKDGAPIGIRNYPGTLSESGTPYDYELLLDALQKVEAANFNPSAVVHPPALARILRGLREDGATGQYLAPPPDLAEVPRMVTTRLPDEAAILGDLKEMVIGVRSNFSLLISNSARLERDTILIAARWRGDIGIARPKAICNLTVTE